LRFESRLSPRIDVDNDSNKLPSTQQKLAKKGQNPAEKGQEAIGTPSVNKSFPLRDFMSDEEGKQSDRSPENLSHELRKAIIKNPNPISRLLSAASSWISKRLSARIITSFAPENPSSSQKMASPKGEGLLPKDDLCTIQRSSDQNNGHFGLQTLATEPERIRPDGPGTSQSSHMINKTLQHPLHPQKKPKLEEPVLSCDILDCKKRYWTPDPLTKHKKMHDNIRPFACNKSGCARRFFTKNTLKRHQTSNVCSKPANFFCDFQDCSKGFQKQCALDVHRRWHNRISSKTSDFVASSSYVCDVPNCS